MLSDKELRRNGNYWAMKAKAFLTEVREDQPEELINSGINRPFVLGGDGGTCATPKITSLKQKKFMTLRFGFGSL